MTFLILFHTGVGLFSVLLMASLVSVCRDYKHLSLMFAVLSTISAYFIGFLGGSMYGKTIFADLFMMSMGGQ